MLAPALLVICRIIQDSRLRGTSLGHFGVSGAPDENRRALTVCTLHGTKRPCWPPVSIPLTAFLDDEQLYSWGWRIVLDLGRGGRRRWLIRRHLKNTIV